MQSGNQTTYLVPQYQYLHLHSGELVKRPWPVSKADIHDQDNTITTPERQALVRSYLIIDSVLYDSWDYYGKFTCPLITLVGTRLTQEGQQRPSNGFKWLVSVHTDHHACQRSVRVRRRKRRKQARCCGNERLRGEFGNQNNAVWRFTIHFNAAVYLAILFNFQAALNVYDCYFEPFTRIKWHTIRFWPSLFFADRQLWERLGDRKCFGCWLHPDRSWYEIKLFRLHCLATCVSMFSIRTPDHILPYNKP